MSCCVFIFTFGRCIFYFTIFYLARNNYVVIGKQVNWECNKDEHALAVQHCRPVVINILNNQRNNTVGHAGSSAGSYLADPTSPIPSHCASIVVTSTLRVNTMMCIQLYCAKHIYAIVYIYDASLVILLSLFIINGQLSYKLSYAGVVVKHEGLFIES